MAKFMYRGITLDSETLPSKGEVLESLQENGADDRALSKYREKFEAEYGNELMLLVTVCDGVDLGCVILPVKEGFLRLPYDHVDSETYECFVLERASLLQPGEAAYYLGLFKEYTDCLLRALLEVDMILQPPKSPKPRNYRDAMGNLYYVFADIGGGFKAFKKLAVPKKGRLRISGVRKLPYVSSREKAQMDLDLYAQKHGLREVTDE